jgi:putative membrane protein
MKITNRIGSVLKFGARAVAAFVLGAFVHASEAKAAPAVSPRSLDDSQIVDYVFDVNRAELAAADATVAKLTAVPVWELALRMRVEHSDIQRKFRSLEIAPEDSQIGQQVTTGSEKNVARLRGLAGRDLEKAYLDNEIRFHKSLLAALDDTLLPSATNDKLKVRLAELRAETAAHLGHAEYIQMVETQREDIDKEITSNGP